jgi:hypothetical protein
MANFALAVVKKVLLHALNAELFRRMLKKANIVLTSRGKNSPASTSIKLK